MRGQLKREKNRISLNRGLCELDDLCYEHKLEKEYKSQYHIRLRGKEGTVDVYPTNKKYCWLFSGKAKVVKWGVYENMSDLLRYLNGEN